MSISSKIEYLSGCYAADTSGTEMLNVFSRAIEHRMFVEPDETAQGAIDSLHIVLKRDVGTKAKEAAYVHRKEKELVYCTLFLAGNPPDSREKVASPLLIYPAKIELVHGAPFLEISHSEFRVNHGLLTKLIDDNNIATQCHDELFLEFNSSRSNQEHAAAMLRILDKFLPDADTDDLILFPNSPSSGRMKAAAGNPKLTLFAAGCVALIKRSTEKRGVIDELTRMADQSVCSRPVQQLLGETDASDPFPPADLAAIPAVLSTPQQAILSSAARNPVTLVVGPPGTGK